jgi:hypothetical protein
MGGGYLSGKKRGLGFAAAVWAAVLAGPVPPQAEGRLEVNVTRVGFPTLRHGDVIRTGAWVPVIVDLSLIDEPSFDGTVRLAQFDTDGDECYDLVDVHLRAETGGSQRVYLYAVANPVRGQGRFIIEVRNQDGDTVEIISQGKPTRRAQPAQQPTVIKPDDILILSISRETVGRVGDLVDLNEQTVYTRPLNIGHMSPSDLPELWVGLEAVDYIVWDDAHPEDLTERQLAALIEWVRQGGTLLITASRFAGSLALTASINKILPVDLGEEIPVKDLPDIRRKLLEAERDLGFPFRVPVVQCKLREGAKLVARERGIDSDIITRGRVDRGSIIFSGITLKDLFSAETGRPVKFFRTIFHLSQLEGDEEPPRPVSLFGKVVGVVSFARSASLYLLLAALFSIGYMLAATAGTWWFLGKRGWRHHSWSTFALVAIAASLLSVLVVRSLRGFGEQLHQITIVDIDAGEAYGYATAFFGLKTSSDRELDVWLPSDPLSATEPGATLCALRPLPAGDDPAEASTSFADPEEYRLVPASALVDDVRIRATLKRFEGRWKGPLRGRVTGQINVRKNTEPQSRPEDWRITGDSYIVNELDVDLKDCYLLHPTFDIYSPTGRFHTDQVRSDKIFAYPIGDVPATGKEIPIASRCYYLATETQTVSEAMQERTLAKQQVIWGSPFRGVLQNIGYGSTPEVGFSLGEEKYALLLLSTVGELDPKKDANLAGHWLGTPTWSRDRLRQLDLRDQLQRDCVYLIGFADQPGPVRLFVREGARDYRPIEPDPRHSRTMYRIRIPAVVEPAPQRDTEEEEDEVR